MCLEIGGKVIQARKDGRYIFFTELKDPELRVIALIADAYQVGEGKLLFEESKPADCLYLLVDGSIDLYFISQEEYHPRIRKEFTIGEINPGELFGISALIEPFVFNASARAAKISQYIKIDARALREQLDQNRRLGYMLMKQAAAAQQEHQTYTRVQLAAAWS